LLSLLFVIPEGNLRLQSYTVRKIAVINKDGSAERLPSSIRRRPEAKQATFSRRLFSSEKACQAPKSQIPAPIQHIRVAHQLWPNRYT
jgi:hypothetical protein